MPLPLDNHTLLEAAATITRCTPAAWRPPGPLHRWLTTHPCVLNGHHRWHYTLHTTPLGYHHLHVHCETCP